jgi:hypothetical protein
VGLIVGFLARARRFARPERAELPRQRIEIIRVARLLRLASRLATTFIRRHPASSVQRPAREI